MTAQKEPLRSPDAAALWRLFHGELFGFVRRRVDSDAASEDILQSAFLRAHQALEAGRAPEEPRAWLYQIARNLIKDVYRSRSRQVALTAALHEEVPGSGAVSSSESDDERDAFALVARALPHFIDSLEAPYQEALKLTELEGLTGNQAAERAGVTLSCMKARVRRGRDQVHAALLRCCTFQVDPRGRMTDCSPREGGSACASCSSDN